MVMSRLDLRAHVYCTFIVSLLHVVIVELSFRYCRFKSRCSEKQNVAGRTSDKD